MPSRCVSPDVTAALTAPPQRDFTGKMGFNEFKDLFTALNGWKQNFMMFDQDRSGTVEPHEMSQAVNAMGESAQVETHLALITGFDEHQTRKLARFPDADDITPLLFNQPLSERGGLVLPFAMTSYSTNHMTAGLRHLLVSDSCEKTDA